MGIATWNLRDMRCESKFSMVAEDCNRYCANICLLQETHITGDPQIIREEGGAFFLGGSLFPKCVYYGFAF